jgi:hypothetical protein
MIPGLRNRYAARWSTKNLDTLAVFWLNAEGFPKRNIYSAFRHSSTGSSATLFVGNERATLANFRRGMRL